MNGPFYRKTLTMCAGQQLSLGWIALTAVAFHAGCRTFEAPAAMVEHGIESTPAQSSEASSSASSTASATLASPAAERSDEGQAPPVRPDGTIYAEAEMMGTHVSINLWLASDESAAKAGRDMRDAFYEIARLEAIASEWRPDSDISRINATAGGAPVEVAPELVEILQRSRDISAATDGLFDVTFHSVGRLWSFKRGATPPSKAAIQDALPLINWRDIEIIDATHVRLRRAKMAMGLGAIAKGYAVDAASKLLRSRGWHHHIVEGGGDTYVAGTKAGQPWMVGVQDPTKEGSIGVIPSSNEAVVTSGNYERYFVHDGKTYAHILDPRTGMPLAYEQSPRSVTLVAVNATDADAYCTAVMVMGSKRGMAFVEAHPELAAIIVDAKGDVHVSSRLRARYQSKTAPPE